MEFKDYYAVLGVKPDTPIDDIKRAYRKLARQYHPDVSKESDAESKFKEINEAWEVIKDPQKRAQYDNIRNGAHQQQAGFNNNQHAYYQSDGQDFSPEQAAQFSEFFESIFGQGGFEPHHARRAFKTKGQDYHVKMSLPLDVAFNGGVQTLQIQVPGQGEAKAKSLQVKIPPGVLTGSQIRLKDQGGPGMHGGPNGDLYIEIEIAVHPYFSLQQKDVYLNLPLTPWEAVLGATLMVPTLGGNVSVKIPPVSQSGKKMRLKGRGMPGNPSGDQYIIFQIQVPEPQNEQDKALFEEMAKTMPFNPRKNLGV